MNLVKNRSLHPHMRDEETALVENAVRLAIDSIINVLCGVNGARTHEYQRMVADRDKEIQRLECRLREIERELQVLRRQGCTCELLRHEHSLGGSQASGDRRRRREREREQVRFDAGCADAEVTAAQQECEMSISLGLFARPPSHVSSQSHESAPPSSPSRTYPDQTCTSHSSETSGVSEAARNLPASPSSLVVKEEPCDIDTVLIKWEKSEERFDERFDDRFDDRFEERFDERFNERLEEHPESAGSPWPDIDSSSVKKKQENRERNKFRDKPQADPGGHQMTEGELLRSKKKSVPMSELPEEAQRLKRAAWRAASRRYYARKVARQQANPSRSDPFPHISAVQYSQPMSFVDKRRRTLISELPEESQTLQREAWRAASRRYYARKVARHQSEPTRYEHLLQDMEPSGETQGPTNNSGGIMCS